MGKKLHGPSLVSFDITYRCNLRCKMCPVWEFGEEYDRRQELSADRIGDIAEDLHARFKIAHFRFLGGEPLLRADLPQIIRRVSGFATTEVTTNGLLLTPERSRQLLDAGVRQINVSLDGPRENSEALRGPGVYDTVVENLRTLVRITAGMGENAPGIKLGNVVTRENYLRLEEVILLARELGVEWHFWLMHDIPGHAAHTTWGENSCEFPRPMPPEAHRILLDDREKGVYWHEFYRLRRIYGGPQHYKSGFGWLEQYLHPMYYAVCGLVNRDCNRVQHHLIIGPGGEVNPCEFLRSVHLGDAARADRDVWNTPEREALNRAIGRGELPACRECNRQGLYRGRAM